MHPTTRLLASLALVALCAGCPSAEPGMDAGTDAARDAAPPDDAASDAAPDAPPPVPGSAEALLREACAGRARTGERATVAYTRGAPMGALRGATEGDLEAIRLTLGEPFRLRTIRVFLRGGATGRARVRLTEDVGRSIPDIERDLIAPVEIDVPMQGWYDVPVDPPVDLHPAHHAWIVVEHLAEPVSLLVATKADDDGQNGRSRAAIASIVQNPMMNPAGDPWLGLGTTVEYMTEAIGERICPRQGAAYFTEVTPRLGAMPVAGGRPQWVDVDGDGWEDLVAFLGPRGATSRLAVFRNGRDGTFTNVTARTGLADVPVSTATWADLDADGDLDLFAGDYQEGTGPFPMERGSRVYLQGADGAFARVAAEVEPPGPTDAHAMGDCDGDGQLDLFVGQWLRTYPTNPGVSLFFRGRGMGGFADGTMAAGLPLPRGAPPRGVAPAFSAMWADYDNDGDADLFVANYLGMANNAYTNDGACRFTDRGRINGFAGTAPRFGTSFGVDFGDYDNDGDLDAFEANIAHPRGDLVMIDRSRLLRNSGAPDYRFENVTVAAGVLHNEGDHEGMFGDWDNDGDLDLLVSVGPAYGYQWWRLYRQEPDHTFVDVTYLAGLPSTWSTGVMFHDADRDGDLDLAVGSTSLRLFRNDLANGNHWIEVRVRDPSRPNRDAIGARITVTTADGVRRLREVTAGRGFHSGQGALTQHVGLGASAGPVTVEVRWPRGNDGAMPAVTRHEGVAVDRVYLVERGQSPRVMP